MEVSYNLRYQKSNFSNKLLIDKEGEIVIYEKGFRLKGKGAGDKGEMINFAEVKEFYYKSERVIFVTFAKEKYVLSDAGTLFNQLLIDIYKARNEFLMDALFMKGGRLKAEFEGSFERQSKFGKLINKGRAKLRLYEKSLVVIPADQDVFVVHYDFVKMHEFDELDYNLKVISDDGSTLIIAQLGNDFEVFEERMNELLGGMFEFLVNGVLREAFPEFSAGDILKMALEMKNGKAVSSKYLRKVDRDLLARIDEFIFQDKADLKANLAVMSAMSGEEGTFYGLAHDPKVEGNFVKWLMFAVPAHNVVGFTILPRWKEKESRVEMYFYKIVMEKGNPAEKLEDKTQEINQALLVLNFAKDPCHKDKRELRHSPYQYAIRKLPYLRILRKSFVAKLEVNDGERFNAGLEEIFKKATLK